MPAGSFTIDAVPGAPSMVAPLALVFRYDGSGDSFLMPNLRLVSTQWRKFEVPVARLRYAFDETFPASPLRLEEVFGAQAWGYNPYAVSEGDRLVVRFYSAYDLEYGLGLDAPFFLAFDGFVSGPQGNLSHAGEHATFLAQGTPIRLYDNKVNGAHYRDADRGDDGDAPSYYMTGLRARFNPGGHWNMTGPGHDENDSTPKACPVFLDWRYTGAGGGLAAAKPAAWSLGPACRYLMWKWNAGQDYVNNPSSAVVDAVLEAWVPSRPGGPIDPKDPATYDAHPVIVSDLDVTGEAFPEAVRKLVEPYGFAFKYILETDGAGNPAWRFSFYSESTPPVTLPLFLQPAGGSLDPNLTNLNSLAVARSGDVRNSWVAFTDPPRYEVGVTLAAGFLPAPADAADANKHQWVEGDTAFDPDKYRSWHYNETGDGVDLNFLLIGPGLSKDPTSLDWLFPPDQNNQRQYVRRRRPGSAHLLTKDAATNARLDAELWVSVDYPRKKPGPWDGTGHWQKVADGWAVDPDRLGVRVTAKDPAQLRLTKPGGAQPDGAALPFPGTIDLVKCTADPEVGAEAKNKAFTFLLVTVLEADLSMSQTAPRRAASPQPFRVEGVAETRDRFSVEYIHQSSRYTQPGPPDPKLPPGVTLAPRDDSDPLTAYLAGMRRQWELATLDGTAQVAYLTTAYPVGAAVAGVYGRGIDFRQNASFSAAEAAVYPVVSGVSFNFDGEVGTTLEFSDRVAPPPGWHRRAARHAARAGAGVRNG